MTQGKRTIFEIQHYFKIGRTSFYDKIVFTFSPRKWKVFGPSLCLKHHKHENPFHTHNKLFVEQGGLKNRLAGVLKNPQPGRRTPIALRSLDVWLRRALYIRDPTIYGVINSRYQARRKPRTISRTQIKHGWSRREPEWDEQKITRRKWEQHIRQQSI